MVEKMKNQELITNKKPLNLQIKNGIKYFPVFVVLCVFAFLLLAPLVWMCLGSFKSDTEVMQYPPKFFPQANHLIENWKKVLTRIDFLTLTKNTVIYAVGCTIPSMFINALAGYAFARFNFTGKNVLFLLFLATMMIPFQVIMVPLFLEVYKMGMYDNFAGLIIPNLGAAMTVFMTRASFAGLPKELEEAARIDGLSEFGIFWKIMLPLVKPTVVTVIVLGINGAWNDLMWPLIVTSNTSMRTLTNGLAMFVDSSLQYGTAFAGAFISICPMLVLYIFGQRYFVEGTATSGLKG